VQPLLQWKSKAISFTRSECVFLALGIQHAMRMRCIILSCGLLGSTEFFPYYLINGTIFRRKKVCLTFNVCFIFSTNFATHATMHTLDSLGDP
jgi:hypothetical protein